MALELICATGNAGKLHEFQEAGGREMRIRGFGPVDCPETGATFEENAVEKALCCSRAFRAKTGRDDALLFADDSGLEVDALGGAPGVRSARFAGEEADEGANNKLLLEELRSKPESERGARFVCVIALVGGHGLLGVFRGEAEGRILESPRGAAGFGYDPLFYYPPLERSFAELSGREKWEHSHRGRAFRAMIEGLRRGFE